MNGNNDLSSDKFNEFADAYFSKNNKEELATLSKTLPEKNVKSANINENIEVNKNDNVDLADNELIANDFNGFDELNLDGKD